MSDPHLKSHTSVKCQVKWQQNIFGKVHVLRAIILPLLISSLVTLSLILSNLPKSEAARLEADNFGYTDEQIARFPSIKDRVMAKRIKKETLEYFAGLDVSPNDQMEQIGEFVEALTDKFDKFYSDYEMPKKLDSKLVAGPTGVGKSMAADFVFTRYIFHKLFLKKNYVFRQGHENKNGLDLSEIERFKITEVEKKDFERLSNKLKNLDDYPEREEDYQKLKNLFLKMMAVIIIDEASHVPAPKYDSVDQAVEGEIEKVLGKEIDSDQQPVNEGIARPKVKAPDSFPDTEEGKRRHREHLDTHLGKLFDYYTQNREIDDSDLIVAKEEVAQKLARELDLQATMEQQGSFQDMFWQALAGGKVTFTTSSVVRRDLKEKFLLIEHERRRLRAENVKLFQADPQALEYIETQVDHKLKLDRQLQGLLEKMRNVDVIKEFFENFEHSNFGPNKLFQSLTVEQFAQWLEFSKEDFKKQGLNLDGLSFNRIKSGTNFFDNLSFDKQSILYLQLIEDLHSRAHLFDLPDIEMDKKMQSAIATIAGINPQAVARDPVETIATEAGETAVEISLGQEANIKADNEAEIKSMKLFEAFGYQSLSRLADQLSTAVTNEFHALEEKIADVEEKIKLVELRKDSYDETQEQLERKGTSLDKVVIQYYAQQKLYDDMIKEAIEDSEVIQDSMRAKFIDMAITHRRRYNEHWLNLEETYNIDADQTIKDLLEYDDPMLIYEHVRGMERVAEEDNIGEMVKKIIKKGTTKEETSYIVANIFFLLNVKEIEAKVIQRIINSGQKLSYDLYRQFYIEEFEKDGKAMTEEDIKAMEGTDTYQKLQASELKGYGWNLSFLLKYMPRLVEPENILASLRRFGRAIFLLPPDNNRVANLVAGRISIEFDKFLQGLPSIHNDVRMRLHIQEDVAKYFVPKEIEANLGVSQTLERVSAEMKDVFRLIEEGLGHERIPKNVGEDKVQVFLTLELKNQRRDEYQFVVRFGPHNFKLKSGILTKEQILDVKFPKDSKIGGVHVSLDENRAYSGMKNPLETANIATNDPTEAVSDRMDNAVRDPNLFPIPSWKIKESDGVGVSQAAEKIKEENRATETREKESKKVSIVNSTLSTLENKKRRLKDLQWFQERMEISEDWFKFMWPPSMTNTVMSRVEFYGYSLTKEKRGRQTRFNAEYGPSEIPNWFINFWREDQVRELIQSGKITRRNIHKYLDGSKGHNGDDFFYVKLKRREVHLPHDYDIEGHLIEALKAKFNNPEAYEVSEIRQREIDYKNEFKQLEEEISLLSEKLEQKTGISSSKSDMRGDMSCDAVLRNEIIEAGGRR